MPRESSQIQADLEEGAGFRKGRGIAFFTLRYSPGFTASQVMDLKEPGIIRFWRQPHRSLHSEVISADSDRPIA